MGRFNNLPQHISPEGKRYYQNIIYPEIPLDENDIYVIATGGDRFDKLAFQFYSKSEYWWIIAAANPEYSEGLSLKPGVQIRIPAKPEKYIKNFEAINR